MQHVVLRRNGHVFGLARSHRYSIKSIITNPQFRRQLNHHYNRLLLLLTSSRFVSLRPRPSPPVWPSTTPPNRFS